CRAGARRVLGPLLGEKKQFPSPPGSAETFSPGDPPGPCCRLFRDHAIPVSGPANARTAKFVPHFSESASESFVNIKWYRLRRLRPRATKALRNATCGRPPHAVGDNEKGARPAERAPFDPACRSSSGGAEVDRLGALAHAVGL